jgi:hypothetical protein
MKILLVFLLVLLTTTGFSQSPGSPSSGAAASTSQVFESRPTGILSGFLKRTDGLPAEGVTVTLSRTRDQVLVKRSLSPKAGAFVFSGLPPDSYMLVFTSVEFKKVIQGPVVVQHASMVLDTIILEKATGQLKEVLIKSTVPLIQTAMDKTTMNVENTSLAVGNTALDLLSRAPGLTVLNDGNMQLNGKQGVTILIDGKLTYLSAVQLTDLLRNTNSGQIRSIEIMAHPPVKYEASGSAGLVNIILKKNKEYGTNGFITTNATVGKYLKANAGIAVNKRTKHFNVYGNYNYADNKRYGILNLDRELNLPGNVSTIEQRSHSTTINHNHSYKAGIDYDINAQNTIGFAVNGYSNSQSEVTDNLSLIGKHPISSLTSAHNEGENRYANTSYNLNYRSVLDTLGQQLNIDLASLNYDNAENVLYENNFLNPDRSIAGLPIIFRNNSATDARIKALKVDFTLPLTKTTKVELGIKTSMIETNNDFLSENQDQALWVKNPGQSNTFLYKESINAGYLNLDQSWKDFRVQMGIRAEHTSTTGNSVSTSNVTKRNYLDIFPVLSLSQKLSPKNTLGLTLNRRIDRPNYGSLNPFMYFLDLYTYKSGNEYLKPQYTNGISINYQFMQKYGLELAYSNTKNVITAVIRPDSGRNALFMRPENLSRQNTIGTSISIPLTLTPFWNAYNDLGVYHTIFSSDEVLGSRYRSGQTAWNVKSSHTFSLNNSIRLDLSGNYQSKQLYGTSYLKSFMFVDMGASLKLWNDRLNVKLGMKDIFDQKKQIIYSNLPGLNYTMYEKPETRLISLSLSYAFGGKEVKAVRNRTNGIGEENDRLGR